MARIVSASFKTSLGFITVSANEIGICDISFGESAPPIQKCKDPILQEAYKQLTAYLQGKRKSFQLPLSIEGTAFQKKIWQALKEIPFGKTLSYSDLAAVIKKPKAFRAAANACGKNQIPIIIPCHRILGKNNLGGFTAGLDFKKKLLELEGIKTQE